MKKLSYLIVLVLILGLALAGCTFLSNISQVPATEQSSINYLTKGLLSDLVGQWHFDCDALDSSGNGNDGMLHNFVSPHGWVPGMFGQALSFGGTNDYVEIANDQNLNITQGTWEAWIKFDVLPSVAGHPMNPLAKANQYWIHGSKNDPDSGTTDAIVVKIRVNGTRYCAKTSDDFITAGMWYHVVGTYDGETLKLYVDGTLVDSNTAPSGDIDTGTQIMAVGTWSTLTDYFQGTIDEVRIWDTATPNFNLNLDPKLDFNPVGTNHTVTATVTIDKVSGGTEPAPGVLVDFTVSGANIASYSDYTNSDGVVTFNHTGSNAGEDTIMAAINEEPYVPVSEEVTKYWLENFVTGGGKINIPEGKKVAWTFAGTVGNLEDGSVGQFQIVDHTSKIAYHCNNNFSYLVFDGDEAAFKGIFTNNKNADTVELTIIIKDLGEPGAWTDTISVTGFATNIGPTFINGGNFQVHDL